MKKLITILMLAVAIIAGGATVEAKTTKKAKAKTSKSSSASLQKQFEADFETISKNLTTFFNEAVLGPAVKSGDKNFLQKYCTTSLINKFKKWAREEGGNGYLTIGQSQCAQDYLDDDHVTRVIPLENQTAMVYYLEMGMDCSKKVKLVKEGSVWKISNYIE